jgi:hypothetical protein
MSVAWIPAFASKTDIAGLGKADIAGAGKAVLQMSVFLSNQTLSVLPEVRN